MKKYFTRVLALALAVIVAVSAVALMASAEDYSNESIVLKTELIKEVDGVPVSVGKVEPGDELKARIYLDISYYTTAIDLIVFYDETFFADSYDLGVTEFSPTINYDSAQCSNISAMMTKLDDSVKIITNLVKYGYLTQDYVDTHQAFLYNVSFTDSKTHMLSDSEWIFELDLTVRNDANGSGSFEFVYDTVQRIVTHERAYININYNTENGTNMNSIPLYNFDIPTTVIAATATTLETPVTTESAPVTTEKATTAPESMPQNPTTAPAQTTTTVNTDEYTTSVTVENTTGEAEVTTDVSIPESSGNYEPTTNGYPETTQYIPEASSTQSGNYPTVPAEDTTASEPALTTQKPASTTVNNDYPTSTTTTVPATTQKQEQTTALNVTIGIRNPTQKAIKYGDGIILHAETSKTLPEGYSIVWEADNTCFTVQPSADGESCTIISAQSGYTKFTAKVVDEDGNVVATSGVREMQSKAGFFWKIIAFFKKLFGLTKLYPEYLA